jgi:hypothetical protein
MGSQSVYVVGKEVAFKARSVIRKNADAEKLAVRWIADVLVHGPDEKTLRVAEVTIDSGETARVVDMLEARGIDVGLYFGSVRDCVAVPRSKVRDALGILRVKPLPGVDVMPPKGF